MNTSPFADEPAQFDEDCYCEEGCTLMGPHEKCEVLVTNEQIRVRILNVVQWLESGCALGAAALELALLAKELPIEPAAKPLWPDGWPFVDENGKALSEPGEERTPIDSPSEICPLIGCKRRDDHQHVVIEHPNRTRD